MFQFRVISIVIYFNLLSLPAPPSGGGSRVPILATVFFNTALGCHGLLLDSAAVRCDLWPPSASAVYGQAGPVASATAQGSVRNTLTHLGSNEQVTSSWYVMTLLPDSSFGM